MWSGKLSRAALNDNRDAPRNGRFGGAFWSRAGPRCARLGLGCRGRGVQDRVDQSGKAFIEFVAAEPHVFARALPALGNDPRFVQRLEVVARRRLRHAELDLAAPEFTGPRATRELSDDLESDRIRERLEHRETVERLSSRFLLPGG